MLQALTRRGVSARAAIRRPDPAAGPDTVRFDWADRDTWPRALAGVDALYLLGPYAEPDGIRLVPELLAAAPGLRRVVHLSIQGVHDLPDAIPMAAWEQHVRDSGAEWTILRPNWFMQNFGSGFAAALRDNGELRLPAGDAAVSFVDTRDIGEVAAAALAEPGHAGRVYDLTGPEALSHAEAVATIARASGRDMHYVALTPEQHVAELRAAGRPEWSIGWQAKLYELIRDGRNAPVTDVVEQVTGRTARTLAAYADEHAAVWRA